MNQGNITEIIKLINPLFFDIVGNNLVIAAKRPVIVKAKLEKLINENKIQQGNITQYLNGVVYEPGTGKKRKDLNLSI